jgi:hypothetical protein
MGDDRSDGGEMGDVTSKTGKSGDPTGDQLTRVRQVTSQVTMLRGIS